MQRKLAPNMPTEQQCSMYILYKYSRITDCPEYVWQAVCEREKERVHLSAYVFFPVVFVAHFDALMTGRRLTNKALWHKFRCSVFSMVGLNKTKTRNSLERYYISWQCFMWEPSTHHQALTRNRHLQQKKKETQAEMCSLDHTHKAWHTCSG